MLYRKKIVFCLTIVMAVLFLTGGILFTDDPKNVYAADNVTGTETAPAVEVCETSTGSCGDLTWTLTSDGTLTISGTGKMYYNRSNVPSWVEEKESENIKKVVIEYGATNIKSNAFYYCSNLVSITIPNSVTEIGDAAFVGCSSLKEITIPDSVTEIGSGAFSGCSSLKEITIPDGAVLDSGIFTGCTALTDMTFGTGVTLGGYMVSGCTALKNFTFQGDFNNSYWDVVGAFTQSNNCDYSLETVTYGDDCTEIISMYCLRTVTTVNMGSGITALDMDFASGAADLTIFWALEELNVSADNPVYASVDDVLYSKDLTEMMFVPREKTGTLSVRNGTTVIDSYAAYGCNGLTKIKIPGSVVTIEEYAFAYCKGTVSAAIGKKVKTIGNYAFYYCSNLKSVTLGENVKSIGDYAFYCCALSSITIPASVKTIGSYAIGFVYGTSSSGKGPDAESDFIIYGYTDTAAEDYADKWGFTFVDRSIAKVKLSTTTYTYNGKARKPTVTVYNSVGKKISSANYTVTYASGRKNCGRYKVTVKGKGKFTGTKTVYFKIKPKKASTPKLTSSAKKKLKVKWTKSAGKVTGYQIAYRVKGGKWKYVTVKSNSKTLAKLKSGKTYQVKVRAYKTIGGKKVYGSWSKVKSKKVK